MSKVIDEKTAVPLSWLVTSIIFAITMSTSAAFYIFRVDWRLDRIERKLGIINPPSSNEANAATRK